MVHAKQTDGALSSGEVLETTDNHPFFVYGAGWVKAGKLSIGNLLVPRAGPTAAAVTVAAIARKAGPATVYNFTVPDDHSYFVGTTEGGTWVHNGPGDCTAGEIAAVAERWLAGTLGTVENSIAYHFAEHGGGMSLQEYTNAALQLWNDGQAVKEWALWDTRWPGPSYSIEIGGEGGFFNELGQIYSYWKH